MTKIILVWLALMVSYSLVTGKEVSEKLEERVGTAENIKSENDQDESASIQVVHRDTTDKVKQTSDETPRKEEHSSEIIHNNLTEAKDAKHDIVFENSNNTDEDILENRDNKPKEAISLISSETIEKKSEHSDEKEQIAAIAGGTSIEGNIDNNNRKEEVFEDIMNSGTPDEIDQIDSSLVEENESNNWRSAENIHSGSKENSKEKADDKSLTEEDRDASVEDFTDKRIHLEVKDRMEVRKPDIKEHIENKRPMNPRRHYRPSEEQSISEPGHVRYGEIIIPRYRPVLTRTGIIYTPTMLSMQPGSSLLDRLAGRSWLQHRPLMQEPEVYNTPRPNRVNVPQYEETKMIDDYNDYGSNTYTYTPIRKVTTQPPPQQIAAPNFDIFQKLVDASNHPKTARRLNDSPTNYHTQRHHSDIYRPYDVRRTRRNITWD